MLTNPFTFDDRVHASRVIQLYATLMNRDPDPDGLRHYTHVLSAGMSFVELVNAFLEADEFKNLHHVDRPISAEYIQTLYAAAVGRSQRASEITDPATLLASLIDADRVAGYATLVPALRVLGPCLTDPVAYAWWTEEYWGNPRLTKALPAACSNGEVSKPAVSIIMPVANVDPAELSETIDAVLAQVHSGLELLLVTQGSIAQELANRVQAFRKSDARVRVVASSRWSSVAAAWNKALRVSTGALVTTLAAGDILEPTATLECAAAAARWPDAQVIYSDEDEVAPDGARHSPRFKADFDFDRMLVGEDTGKLTVFRRDLLVGVKGWRRAATEAAEYDLTLRVTARLSATAIRHLSHVLVHRRRSASPATSVPGRLAAASAFLAVARPGTAIGLAFPSDTGLIAPVVRVSRPRASPSVSIVIPTRNRLDLLKPCIAGLRERTSYRGIEIVVVDHESDEPDTVAFLSDLARQPGVCIVPFHGSFNWGAANNAGISASRGEVVVLLNNDIEVVHADWLDELVGQAMRSEVGAVGAKLLYPDRRLQHGGIVVGPDGAGRHVFRNTAADDLGYDNLLATVRTVSAVTGACVALRRNVIDEVGGIEQNGLQVTCSDVDLCMRVRERGYRVIWTPFARLWHKELATRGGDDTPEKVARAEREQSYLAGKWARQIETDRHWPPNLAISEQVGCLALPPRGARA